ncbi:MAG: CpsD/CapB family tyrosine-protein kinase [Phycisphaerae bacterium]|nr:CpsD/CapB family tyrosine-protein kinase [Phycisphaerae bacterium]
MDLSQWTGSIETSGKVTDGEPEPAPQPEPAVDQAPGPQEAPAPVPTPDDAERDEDDQASMPTSGAAAALHESEEDESPPGLYNQISSSKFNEELSSPQYDDAIAPSTAVAAVRRMARNAELKDKADDLFRGMWASIFYSGRMTGKATLVTAPSRNEGVSTIACGLAVAGSGPAGGARVCLVDFNLRAPAIHERLGLRQAPGLTEVLTGAEELHNVIQGVNESLDVVTVGTIGGRSLDVLRSDAVEEFFEILNDAYDYILVDVAAANHYPDAQVLAGVVGDVVLVTHADQTPREAVAQAKKQLEAGGGKLVGLVLNQRSFPIPSFLYRRV